MYLDLDWKTKKINIVSLFLKNNCYKNFICPVTVIVTNKQITPKEPK